MGSIKSALEQAGFSLLGPCSSCNGRAWDYDLNGFRAKVKTDRFNNEIVVTFNGIYNGRRVRNEIAVPHTIEQKLNEIGITDGKAA